MKIIIVARTEGGVFVLTRSEGSQAQFAEAPQSYETWGRLEEVLRESGVDDARVTDIRDQLRTNNIAISKF
jgi:hypothetical protein